VAPKGFTCAGATLLKILSKWCTTKEVHFCSELIKTAGGPDETCPSAKVFKMSNIEHFPGVEGCIMWW
jgi:hypothetical protein